MQKEILVGDTRRPNLKTKPLARRHSRICTATALAIAGLALSLTPLTQASSVDPTNLIMNSEFTTTNGRSSPIQLSVSGRGQPTFSGAVIGPWTASGLAFLFGPAPGRSGTNADIGNGAPNFFARPGRPGFCLYGPGACGGSRRNGLTIGPNGGNFVALDGALTAGSTNIRGSISETLRNLTPDVPAMVTFNWATGQQAGKIGSTTAMLQVSLCPSRGTCPTMDTMTTPTLTNPQGGFQTWRKGSFEFTPTSSTEVLTFMGIGTPTRGGPPFVLLDSPMLTQQKTPVIPEPGTWLMLGIGIAAMAGVAYRRPQWLGLTA